ncbi:MAG: hypothetical protein IIA88_00265 [Bacteroidetes bacterium]|nr:hypothetical protein [Bacteroidota bacterium]
MYTNELLEEKYKAQKQIATKAKKQSKNYLQVVEEEVGALFKKFGWSMNEANREGGYLKKKSIIQNKYEK